MHSENPKYALHKLQMRTPWRLSAHPVLTKYASATCGVRIYDFQMCIQKFPNAYSVILAV